MRRLSRPDDYTPEAPLDDLEHALRLLLSEHRIDAWLKIPRRGPIFEGRGAPSGRAIRSPRIVVNYYDRRGEWFRHDIFFVSDHVVTLLKHNNLVQGREHWGYTDYNECKISDLGEAKLCHLRELREDAETEAANG